MPSLVAQRGGGRPAIRRSRRKTSHTVGIFGSSRLSPAIIKVQTLHFCEPYSTCLRAEPSLLPKRLRWRAISKPQVTCPPNAHRFSFKIARDFQHLRRRKGRYWELQMVRDGPSPDRSRSYQRIDCRRPWDRRLPSYPGPYTCEAHWPATWG
jgi:hypothetical protein